MIATSSNLGLCVGFCGFALFFLWLLKTTCYLTLSPPWRALHVLQVPCCLDASLKSSALWERKWIWVVHLSSQLDSLLFKTHSYVHREAKTLATSLGATGDIHLQVWSVTDLKQGRAASMDLPKHFWQCEGWSACAQGILCQTEGPSMSSVLPWFGRVWAVEFLSSHFG